MTSPRGPRFVGDTKQARDGAWVFTAGAALPLVVAAFLALTWYRAQVEGWSQNPRVPHEGDPFPWLWVVVCVVASAFFLRIALRSWGRYRALRAADRGTSAHRAAPRSSPSVDPLGRSTRDDRKGGA